MKNNLSLWSKFISQLQNTDKLYSIGDSAIISLGRFAAGITLAKLAGAEAFAQYLLLMTAGFFILSIPSTLCILPMVNIASGLKLAERRGIFSWTYTRLRWFYAGAAICAALAYPVIIHLSVSPALYLGFVCATIAGLELLYQRACLQVTFKMKNAVLSDFIGLLILVVLVSLSWHFYQSPVLGFWWGSAASSLLSSMLMRIGANRGEPELYHNKINKPNNEVRKHVVTSGTAMLVGSIANSGCSKIAPFALGSIGGLLTVASFGASWTLLGPLRMLSGALSGMLRPRLAMYINTGDKQAFNHSIRSANILVTSVGFLGIVVSALIGPRLVSFIFEPSLREAGFLLPLAMTYATIEVITTIQVIALHTKLKNGAAIASKLRVTAAMVSLTIIFPACLWIGALGAYLTLLISEFLYFYCAQKSLKGKTSIIRPEEQPIFDQVKTNAF